MTVRKERLRKQLELLSRDATQYAMPDNPCCLESQHAILRALNNMNDLGATLARVVPEPIMRLDQNEDIELK